MDIHRSRFVPYPASAITAFAFSRPSNNGYTGPLPALKLAIGKSDGSVEVWNPEKGLWVQETILYGEKNSIDSLAWTQDPDDHDADGRQILGQQRLFSIASSPAVTEWNLATGEPKRRSTGNFSEVWCFAAQPRWRPQKNSSEEPQAQQILAGCGDGTLVLLSTADDDLQFKRFLARVPGKRARCMCVTWQSRERAVAGFADGVIRIYDTRSGSQVRSMSLGIGTPGFSKNPIVWQVKCLPNGDIVSSDSNGEVKFWDGRTYSLSQRIAGHDVDCVDLIASNDGRTVFAGDMDGKIAVYRQSNDSGRRSWSKGSHRRVHNDEIKAMAAFDSKDMSVVVSGSTDGSPLITPLREFGKENTRHLPNLPQCQPLASAPKARLIVSWWEKTIYVWRIARHRELYDAVEHQKAHKLVARLNLSTSQDLRSVSISPDGKVLAASTSTEVKVFQLRKRLESDSLAVRRIKTPDDSATSGARLLQFSPDGKWLVAVSPGNQVNIVRLATDTSNPKHIQIVPKVVELDRQHRKASFQTSLKEYDRTIVHLAFASASSVLVAADLSGYLDSWVLEGNEDPSAPPIDIAKHDSENGSSDANSETSFDSDSSEDDDSVAVFFGQHWTSNPAGHLLMKLDSQPLVMTFRPTTGQTTEQPLVNGNPGVHSTRHNPHAHSHTLPHGQLNLFIMTAKHRMFELDVLGGKLSNWSRRNPSAVLPSDFTKIRDRVMGGVWDSEGRLWLYGTSFLCMLNVAGDLGDRTESQGTNKQRRKRNAAVNGGDISKRRKLESGAGGEVESARNVGIVDVVKRYEDNEESRTDAMRQAEPSIEDDDDDDQVGFGLQLTRMESGGEGQEVQEPSDATSSMARKSWSTFKYRPILGVVPIEDELGQDSSKPVEIVLVERPPWDVKSEKE